MLSLNFLFGEIAVDERVKRVEVLQPQLIIGDVNSAVSCLVEEVNITLA